MNADFSFQILLPSQAPFMLIVTTCVVKAPQNILCAMSSLTWQKLSSEIEQSYFLKICFL